MIQNVHSRANAHNVLQEYTVWCIYTLTYVLNNGPSVQESVCFGQLSILLNSAYGNHWAELPDGSDL